MSKRTTGKRRPQELVSSVSAFTNTGFSEDGAWWKLPPGQHVPRSLRRAADARQTDVTAGPGIWQEHSLSARKTRARTGPQLHREEAGLWCHGRSCPVAETLQGPESPSCGSSLLQAPCTRCHMSQHIKLNEATSVSGSFRLVPKCTLGQSALKHKYFTSDPCF